MTAGPRAARGARLLPLVGLLALAGCGGSSHPTATTKDGCAVVPLPKMGARAEPKPTVPLALNMHYSVTLLTNCGSFTIAVDQAESPHAAASFVSLARRGFFTDTIFPRIALGFVIQGGDPTGTGTGGPGYTTLDTPPANATYPHGIVAMAKTTAQAPGTAGSQFFVVTEASAALPPDYAIIGTVSRGLEVVDRIGKLGNAQEQPTMVVEIEKVTVNASG